MENLSSKKPQLEGGDYRWFDLRFKNTQIEKQFIRHYFERYVHRTRMALALSAMVLVAYALLDSFLLQTENIAAQFRILFALPMVVLALIGSFAVRHYLFYLLLAVLTGLVASNQILFVYLIGMEIVTFATMAFLQILLFAAVLYLIPFVYTFFLCVLATAGMLVALEQIGGGHPLVVNYQVALAGVLLVSIAFSYSRERSLRELYWQEIELTQLRIESEKQKTKQVTWLRNLSSYLELELRNHVFAAQSNLEDLRDSSSPGVQSRVNRSIESLDKLVALCDVVAKASSLESALEMDQPRAVDFSRLVEDRVYSRARVIEETNPIELDIEANLWVNADAERLIELFDILLTNAVQHSSAEAHIKLSARSVARRVFLTIHNHGDPLPQGDHIFDAFDSSRPSTNLGVGLYVAKEIVEHLGGKIEARTHLDETMFVVVLPQIDALSELSGELGDQDAGSDRDGEDDDDNDGGQVLRFNRMPKF